ncbi:hypothetical protein CpB0458 [Chlamydia pneumoniae TW-183]|uniref:Uncharacterized protein CPn_0442/CP_0311/CPj0442/CpB0458 n=2 Tax=Chlamydia pneumoniae TaxID=83558 RepID=A0A0F7WPP7_CHLPN|nr:DUF5422 family protein [Chlamydia pneumoniae]AAD18586.1 CT006 hypothetical protein [Chlamydia pneumoniae CWL029]AAP98389.1 hypothetical protein CpB0458 [Chlamydia pneumoniae TW-183]CRI32944.1 Uncharacterized protein CPn_0442/CP_0311/CPj0442/CpB0458 [Chlamydia pneumoniae]CRI35807.1 Uncharacterized protein CPn_0442/CP_0311/CPj0442/CpB0458 [Chlamydia pneumoniae]CRI36936.1 Uncharacterized protein CPn_0442/CP_0311/CPj0442/CpB0458 [Chlamydia pneumoniae]
MGFKNICKQGSQLYLNGIFPERILARKLKNCAKSYPRTALTIEVLVSSVLGALKVILIPCASTYAALTLPLRALFNAIKTKSCQHLASYAMAWLLHILTIAVIIGLVFSLVFIPPPVVFISLGLLMSVTTSVTLFQVHKNLFPPYEPPPSRPHTPPPFADEYVPLISESYFD